MTPGWDNDWWGRDPIEQAGEDPRERAEEMKEPSPEDMSYLSDPNIEWCLEHYLREYAKRNRKKAMACWSDLGMKFLFNVEEFEEVPQFFKANVHRSSP
jgi:hypothetical protein